MRRIPDVLLAWLAPQSVVQWRTMNASLRRPLNAPRAARVAVALVAALGVAGGDAAAAQVPPAPAAASAEDEALYAEERREADLDRRRGKPASAVSRLEELLGERSGDAAARALLAGAYFDLARYAKHVVIEHDEHGQVKDIRVG